MPSATRTTSIKLIQTVDYCLSELCPISMATATDLVTVNRLYGCIKLVDLLMVRSIVGLFHVITLCFPFICRLLTRNMREF
jgi:hypothetical protein